MSLVIPSAEELPTLTRREREYIAHLNRRREFLEERIKTSDLDLTWDKVELKALTWAIGELCYLEVVDDDSELEPFEIEQLRQQGKLRRHECAPGRCCTECGRHVTPHKGCVLR